MNEQKYQCKCFKCGGDYESTNELDLDGDEYCPSCLEKKKVIAEKVDKLIKQRRLARGDVPQVRPANVYFEAGN